MAKATAGEFRRRATRRVMPGQLDVGHRHHSGAERQVEVFLDPACSAR
jgi:hypothetical protein